MRQDTSGNDLVVSISVRELSALGGFPAGRETETADLARCVWQAIGRKGTPAVFSLEQPTAGHARFRFTDAAA